MSRGADFSDDADEHGLTMINLAALVANYREAGAGLFVLAYFVEDEDVLRRPSPAPISGRPSRPAPVSGPSRPSMRQ